MHRTLFALAFLPTWLAGCESGVHIVGSLAEHESPLAIEGGAVAAMLDGSVLITGVVPSAPPGPGWPPFTESLAAQWIAADGTASARIDLGWSTLPYGRTTWVPVGDRVYGTVWATTTPGAAPPPAGDLATAWSLTAGDTIGCTRAVHIDALDSPGSSTISPGADLFTAYAAARAGNRAVSVASANPAACWQHLGRWVAAPIVQHDCDATAVWATTFGDCSVFADSMLDATAFSVSENDVGVLFRSTPGGRTRFARLVGGTQMREPSIEVGRIDTDAPALRSAAVGSALGDHVVFAEPTADARCATLRVFELSSGTTRDAPWQFPCDAGHRVVTIELHALPSAILLAYDASDDVAATNHVRVLVLTEHGERGSDPIELTGILSGVAVDGNDIAIGIDGTFVERLRFSPL